MISRDLSPRLAVVLLCIGVTALVVTFSADEAPETEPTELLQQDGVEYSRRKDEAIFARRGNLEKMAVKMKDEIPTLDFSKITAKDLRPTAVTAAGSALKTSLAGLVRGLARKRANRNFHISHSGDTRHNSRHTASRHHKIQSLDYSDPNHHEPYDQEMETEEWFKLAKDFRAKHPLMDAKEEQKQLDELWRKKNPWFYHAYGPMHGGRGDTKAKPPLKSRHPGAQRAPGPGQVNDVVFPPAGSAGTAGSHNPVHVVQNPTGDVPETVLAPPEDGVHDFDGNSAIIATIPRLGEGPSKLDDKGEDARGTFLVRVYGASGQPELVVKRMIGGLGHPFKCKYRAYRKLSGDFAGNVVYTGFMRAYHSSGDEILTGMTIPPSGNKNEFDIMTCRDDHTGEVQYFKLRPEVILARMRSNHCAGYIPSGSIGDCGW